MKNIPVTIQDYNALQKKINVKFVGLWCAVWSVTGKIRSCN